jgi:hypothetical protein
VVSGLMPYIQFLIPFPFLANLDPNSDKSEHTSEVSGLKSDSFQRIRFKSEHTSEVSGLRSVFFHHLTGKILKHYGINIQFFKEYGSCWSIPARYLAYVPFFHHLTGKIAKTLRHKYPIFQRIRFKSEHTSEVSGLRSVFSH